MKRAIKFTLLAAMFLAVAAITYCDAADVSTNTVNEKPVVMNGLILDTANAKTEKDFTPEQQAANFKPGFDAGISNATKRIELDPENVTAYANRGRNKIAKRDYDGAIVDYTKIIGLNKTFIGGAYYDRGLAKQAKGDFDGAIADFTKAVELNPNNYAKGCLYYPYSARGYVKLSKGDFEGAIVDFNKALEIQPDYASAYLKRGSAKLFKGDLDGAIEDYTKIIELKPAQKFYYTAAYYNRGFAKGAKGDFDGEKADLTDALKLNPGFSEAQMRLDELHQK